MTFAGLVTRSPAVSRLFAALGAVAPAEVSVLLEGESGTGKQTLAEAVHRASARASESFIVFDCAAASPLLAQCELFGCEAETSGAPGESAEPLLGAMERANRGTLVLKNVDALAPHLQIQVSRALQRRKARRQYGLVSFQLDLRVISLSSRSLIQQTRHGLFRSDLYRTLSERALRVPPLRQRLEDLPVLAESLLAEFQPALALDQIPEHVWRAFLSRPWPGNVRELKNALIRALLTPDLFERQASRTS